MRTKKEMNHPVIVKHKKKQTNEFPIPDWCPMLKK